MARYTGTPRTLPTPRFETALCGKDVYGVYDNQRKCFARRDLTKAEADAIVTRQMGRDLDRMLIRLASRF